MHRRILIAFALLCPALATAQPLPAPPFAAPWLAFETTLPGGAGDPVAMAVADFTGDGRPDVVVAQARSGTGFVLMVNDGQGRLARRTAAASLQEAADIVAADFNGDGRADVAVTNANSLQTAGNAVSLYLGRGNGTFDPRRDTVLGSGLVLPAGLAAADLDGDGDLDLAAAAHGLVGSGSTVVVLRGDGIGGFAAPASYPAGPAPYGIAAGDMDADGDIDLVVTNEGSRLSVLRNMGAASFAAPIAYPDGAASSPASAAVALGDVDGDGDLDVFYGSSQSGNGTSGHAVLLRNDGAGVLGDPSTVSMPAYFAGPVALVAADLDADGDRDLIAVHSTARTSDGLVVAFNDGTGAFGPAAHLKAGQSTADVAAADMDGDGDLDLLATDDFSRAITVRPNPGGGVFPAIPTDYAEFVQSHSDVADVDGDGDLDAFTSGVGVARTFGAVLRNNGAGRFTRTGVTLPSDGVAFGVLRDLNGDGRPDLLFNNPNTASQSDFFTSLNNGSGTFPAPTRRVVGAAGWGHVDAVDLDHDGDLDVVDMEALGAPGIPAGRFFIAQNNGDGTFQAPSVYDALPGRPYDVAPGDYNGDGHVDLAMTRPGAFGFDDQVMIVLGNGDATFSAPIVHTVGRGPRDIVAADLDGDGRLDLATGNTGYDNAGVETMTVLFGTGTGTFTRLATYRAPYSPDLLGITGIEAGDVDRDGDRDILLTGVSNDVTLYVNDGAGLFTVPYRLGLGADAASPWYADFTGDARLDMLALTGLPLYGLDVALSVLPGLVSAATAVEPGPGAPLPTVPSLALSAPSPNPGRGAVHFTLDLAEAQPVRVEAFDILGRRVAVLKDGPLPAGVHRLALDGSKLAAGIYLIRATAGAAATSRRVVILR